MQLVTLFVLYLTFTYEILFSPVHFYIQFMKAMTAALMLRMYQHWHAVKRVEVRRLN
jgi:hypothetical protein